ncbi:hypothetical protein E4634_17430 [Mangrovimicrobium sediminis]|uniref:PEP-CTERM sorting domain-containing protein n=1 Tax=Mangrovimicrobium sediminis TaxID=2562682 RepID=A0A4Z0LX17_9GAMM|nr:hypothetical protein [Haliea sp. SAOS-164]TGD71892.1 hypothetical protein E4634_17430 [Haliea sp. SAOS-164]
MKKLASMALAISLGAGGSTAMAQAVTASYGGGTVGAGTSTTVGSGTGNLSGDMLTISYTETRSVTAPIVAVVEISGSASFDFSGPASGTFTDATCTPVSGFDVCPFLTLGTPKAYDSVTGTWDSFTTVSIDTTAGTATTTLDWSVAAAPVPPTPGPVDAVAVPALPLAGLGLLIAGMLGLGGRRLRK